MDILKQAFIDVKRQDSPEQDMGPIDLDSIHERVFYAEVVVCEFGQYSTGDMGDGQLPVPILFDTIDQAQDSINDMVKSYQQDIDEGHRDNDDEYEGVVMAVKWSTDDTLTFFEVDDIACAEPIANRTVKSCCGQ